MIATGGAARAADFTLSSPGLPEGATLPVAQVADSFGCTGLNKAPALTWTAPPAGAKSFVLTVYDPDAPTGSGFWHWTVFNLPTSARGLPAGATAAALPGGAGEGRTDYGVPGFGGACPPPGDPAHHCIFTLYAVDVDHLPLDGTASGAVVGFMLHYHTLAKTTLTLRYGR